MNATDQLERVLLEPLDALGLDWYVDIDIAVECGWGVEVKVVNDPRETGRPDGSIVAHMAGDDLEHMLATCVADVVKRVGAARPLT